MPKETYTAGPWNWFGCTQTGRIYLATENRGRIHVMDFARWGMQGAQPRFAQGFEMVPASEFAIYQVGPGKGHSNVKGKLYRYDIAAIDHPDARLIAAAPDLLESLKELITALGEDHSIDLQKAKAAIFKAEGKKDV